MKNKEYKYLAIDLDGTLLTSSKVIDDYTIQKIKKLKNEIHIILCSSRTPLSTKYIAEALELEEPIVSFNGSVIMDKNRKIIKKHSLSLEVIKKIVEISEKFNLELLAYTEDSMIISEFTNLNERWLVDILPLYKCGIGSLKLYEEFQNLSKIVVDNIKNSNMYKENNIIKLVLLPSNSSFDEAVKECNIISGLFPLSCNVTPRYIEITSNEIDKNKAMESILSEGESMREIVAIGDNINDESLLKNSGLGVAVSNANSEIRKVARKLTASNDDNGVGKLIKEIWRV